MCLLTVLYLSVLYLTVLSYTCLHCKQCLCVASRCSCVEFGSGGSVSVEYTQQLLLTILHQIWSSFGSQTKEQMKGLRREGVEEREGRSVCSGCHRNLLPGSALNAYYEFGVVLYVGC